MPKVTALRKKYPEFVYKGYSYRVKNKDLQVFFDFRAGGLTFQPKVEILNGADAAQALPIPVLNNLIFHLGLAEMPSYWKATASPKIIVEANYLNKSQITWWHDLFMRGMGQYFYENHIDFTKKNFLSIESRSISRPVRRGSGGMVSTKRLSKRTLVPIGGGKDAVVTLELLKKAKQEVRGFVLNPKKEQQDILKIAKMGDTASITEKSMIVKRTIDPALLELNQKGYLNGHTPFSSYLAFLAVLCGVLFDYKYIAFSNERSSNEGNVTYLTKTINHQYSKSFDFEKKFRTYSKKYLARNIEYFSLLRPLYELQIAKLFSRHPKYFATFLSCNQAHKTNSGLTKPSGKWCGVCSKCLFVFAALYPFVTRETLVKTFGSNLFENKALIPLMEELVGERNFKPFECVGTTKESLAALYLSLETNKTNSEILLQHFARHILPKHPNIAQYTKKILTSWDTKNFVPPHLEKLLKIA